MFAPAARVTDMHTCPMVTGLVPHVGGPIMPPGKPTTLICGLPAATVTCQAVCVGPPDVIVMGSFTCLIGGLPAARIGDMTAHGGVITLGCPTVLIGDTGGGGGGGGAGAGGGGAASAQVSTMKSAAEDGVPFCEVCEEEPDEAKKGSWIEIKLVDDEEMPVPNERYRVEAPDGEVLEGTLDGNGFARLEVEPGDCKVTFPDLDERSWKKI